MKISWLIDLLYMLRILASMINVNVNLIYVCLRRKIYTVAHTYSSLDEETLPYVDSRWQLTVQ